MPILNLSDEILTQLETAQVLGISERTLARRRAEGLGPPYVKHGRKITYFKASVLGWLKGLERSGVRSP